MTLNYLEKSMSFTELMEHAASIEEAVEILELMVILEALE